MRLVFLFFVGFLAVQGYVFECLSDCECDTGDEVIHCHNGERTQLRLPSGSRLRGFPVIGITYNQIRTLPDEETLLAKFPDLKIIDVERNPFDCSTLDQYEKIKIVSDCFKNASEIANIPRMDRPTKDCDLQCQASKHYDKLHEYVLTLWEILKEKYENFDLDTTLSDIQKFFTMVAKKINNVHQDINSRLESARKHPKQVTPMPEPAEITVDGE